MAVRHLVAGLWLLGVVGIEAGVLAWRGASSGGWLLLLATAALGVGLLGAVPAGDGRGREPVARGSTAIREGEKGPLHGGRRA